MKSAPHHTVLSLAVAGVLLADLPSLTFAQAAEEDVSLNGTRLTFYPRPSAAQCQADCAANPQCQASTWIAAGTYNPTDAAMCYLMSAVTGRSPARGHVSLVREAAQPPSTLDASDLGDL
jgi:hypothetical protein